MTIDPKTPQPLGLDCTHRIYGRSLMVHADCFHWLKQIPDNSIDAVVTDPPYGVREYEARELEQCHRGSTGIWRIPPSFDGNRRALLLRRWMTGSAKQCGVSSVNGAPPCCHGPDQWVLRLWRQQECAWLLASPRGQEHFSRYPA